MSKDEIIILLCRALRLAVGYLAVVRQGQNPEYCAVPLSVGMRQIDAMMETAIKEVERWNQI